jgi:hypothetical protein
MTLNIHQFAEEETALNTYEPVLLSWNKKTYPTFAPMIILDISKTKEHLNLFLTLRFDVESDEPEDDIHWLTFKVDYETLAKHYGKTKNEILSCDVRFNTFDEVPNEVITIQTYGDAPKNSNGVISIEKLIESILDYSFK